MEAFWKSFRSSLRRPCPDNVPRNEANTLLLAVLLNGASNTIDPVLLFANELESSAMRSTSITGRRDPLLLGTSCKRFGAQHDRPHNLIGRQTLKCALSMWLRPTHPASLFLGSDSSSHGSEE
jgi:hypothetical protein